jgi:regulator of protease activity HflC (stomatin/prohibitin superfamily)
MLILEQVWGAHNGLMEPGLRCCYWFKYDVACMISRNTVRFNCPILNAPTKDNVRVCLDVGINFHIGRNEQTHEEDAVKFFYNFGPNRLEELLSQETEEQIRNYVSKIKIMKIQD